MNSKRLVVSKIFFKCKALDCYAIILSENKYIIFAANVSADMEIDGFSIIIKNKIRKISSKGRRSIFRSKIIKLRQEVIDHSLEITPKTKLRNIFGLIKGIVGIDFLYSKEAEGVAYKFGYVDKVLKNSVDIRLVGNEGQIDWNYLGKVQFVNIVKLEWGTRYIQAFELLHETSKSVLLKKWKNARTLGA